MQKNTSKSMVKVKRYGEPYARKHLLRRGDFSEIAKITGYSKISISQQMAGVRTMHPTVLAIADRMADRSQAIIDQE